MKKKTKKTLAWVAFFLIMIPILFGLFWFIKIAFFQEILHISQNSIQTWSANVNGNDLNFVYSGPRAGDVLSSFAPQTCYDLELWTDCRGWDGGYLMNADQSMCQSLGGTWGMQGTGQGCMGSYLCYFGSIDFSKYVIKNETITPGGLEFNFSRLKATGKLNICNPTSNQYGSFSYNIVLTPDYSTIVYQLQNNICTTITMMKSQQTTEFTNLADCQANIIVINNTNQTQVNQTNQTIPECTIDIDCSLGKYCNNSVCIAIPPIVNQTQNTTNITNTNTSCGDGLCQSGENYTICAVDCPLQNQTIQNNTITNQTIQCSTGLILCQDNICKKSCSDQPIFWTVVISSIVGVIIIVIIIIWLVRKGGKMAKKKKKR